MIKRILLCDVEQDKSTPEVTNKQMTNHPIGLLYLASVVNQKYPDIEFRIFHTTTFENAERDIQLMIEDFRPELVGLRALSLFQNEYESLAAVIRNKAPDVYIIGGGPFPSASFTRILENNSVDMVVLGEGDETFLDLVSRLREHDELPIDVNGTVLMVNGEVKINNRRPLIQNLDALPFPNYDLINLDDYVDIPNHSLKLTTKCGYICSSRGCPYRCFYCHTGFGKGIRRRSKENVVDEMRNLSETKGIKEFIFLDDLFNVPRKDGKELLEHIAKSLPDVQLNFPNGLRADQMDSEFIDLLEECNTVHMALAIETATPRLQKICGKRLKIDKAYEIIQEASKRFIVVSFFMIGFPTETVEEAMETVRLASSLEHVTQPVLNVVRVYPETALFDFLDPTPEEARLIEQQTAAPTVGKLNEDPDFYGDFFS
ncbi:MAG: hypothetical protein CMM74_15690, partial [Rhodospirillaceae bacterium]|nr:hypothetical protein [Rhodospirillaceae bacterium]